jgi:hypothetical protein
MHVLLPVVALLRRADLVGVIGAALAAKAAGVVHRRVAVALAHPAETVRGWLRRFAGRLGVDAFDRVVARAGSGSGLPAAAGNEWADVVSVLETVTAAVARRFASTSVLVATVASGGRLLAPSWPPTVDQHEFTLSRQ